MPSSLLAARVLQREFRVFLLAFLGGEKSIDISWDPITVAGTGPGIWFTAPHSTVITVGVHKEQRLAHLRTAHSQEEAKAEWEARPI